jgi:hypothetical protein
MTMDPATIEAGDATDRLIWALVMGREPGKFPIGNCYNHDDDWTPSTNMAHAWDVVASRYGWRAVLWQTSAAWACVLMPRNAAWTLDMAACDPRRADADTAPLAICRAALAAVAR